ncbi:cache domain-containing sensor histidine kinase [Caproiciproducens sp. CPB-2]|uniref:cache domain-containing sensor histidine kinase n=1 Tax=Caproiciproducens sp. CPB-2 TaxID=3030017 RepID=UPI0023DA97EF|nr:sensor histidine kinase [Caproiciproducens sp. CPB-2]MDF1493500.1 sensor histidine kinase [Caproiciproducens sp. CPB-2]
MRKILDKFLNIRFRNKMVLSYLFMALIPFAVFSIVSGLVFVNQAQQTAMDHTAQTINQVCDSIDVYIGTIEKTANYISVELKNNEFWNLQSEEDPKWKTQTGQIRELLQNIASSHDEIAGILIATRNDLYVSTGMSRISRDSFHNESWYRQAEQSPEEIRLISDATGRNIVTNQDYSVDDVFSLTKAVRDPKTGEVLGVILFDIRHDIIKKSINSVTIGEKGFVFVTDADNSIVYAPVNDVVYRVSPLWLGGSGNAFVTANIRGGNYQIHSEKSEYTGWRTVGVFSNDEVMAGVNTIIYILFGCILFTVLFVLFSSFELAETITKPIFKLQTLMKQAEGGDLSVRFNSKYNDEIGELGLSFNHMIDQIGNLIRMVYVEQQNKRFAELKSLQEQIKPHFLYNTLDTISWMARDYGASDIVRLVDALTSMFRIGLSHGKDMITIREEITHVSNYLYIQKIRYKDKLNYRIEVNEKLAGCKVPKLILQPLVENAIYHGVKEKRGGGTIAVTAHRKGNLVVFRVHDDGAGIPADRLELLNHQLNNHTELDQKQSFGLFYIQERIQLCYGKEYGISIESREGEETTVTVILPADDGG